jgi:peptidoglycan/xylan/chitin deacetylase (PgdA/CDA1 family)
MHEVPILTYHSQNIAGGTPADNDHLALAADLVQLTRCGYRIVPLDHLTDWMDGNRSDEEMDRCLCLTFDDGCDFDVRDLDYPGHGVQRSFMGILQDFAAKAGPAAQPELHATSFVIASSEARRTIDAGSLFARGWIGNDWWRRTDQAGLIAIGNHSWDHNHPDLEGEGRGQFHAIDSMAQCLEQVVRAGAAIEAKTGRWPCYFAYPFGESSAYIREQFFPSQGGVHGCVAALGTVAGKARLDSDRWNLPRFVCGRDWKSPQELIKLIRPV